MKPYHSKHTLLLLLDESQVPCLPDDDTGNHFLGVVLFTSCHQCRPGSVTVEPATATFAEVRLVLIPTKESAATLYDYLQWC